MTLFRLSLRNAVRQAGDYLVYFVTITMAATLVYAFNGLVFSREIQDLSDRMDRMPLIVVLASMAVICIIGWLVQYTTGFMLTRRSRELGTYILIGLENRQVAGMFLLENLTVGGLALAIGTLLGALLYQVLRAVTLALFQVPYTFRISFSANTVCLTLLYFSLIYLFALFKCQKRIRNLKIYDLIYFDRQNEREVIGKSGYRRKIFVISILFGVTGTILLSLRILMLGIAGSFLIILFLYGFFISFSSGVPAYYDKHAVRKYRGQTLLIFRALSAKLATMGVVMATIAMLFTATLITEGTGILFHALLRNRAVQTTCFDLFISSSGGDTARFDEYLSYIEANIPVKNSQQYQIYRGNDLTVSDYIGNHAKYWKYFKYDTLMTAGDYSKLRLMLGYPEVTVEPGQYRIHCMSYLKDLMEEYSESLTVGDRTLNPGGVSTENFTQSLWDGNGRGFIIIVPDDAVTDRPVSHRIFAAMTEEPVSMPHYNALINIRDEKEEGEQGYETLYAMAAEINMNATDYALLVFPLYYLALVLTMVSATILTIQQLSETDRYRSQFELLRKLGMDRGEMRRTLRRQFAIYYMMPAVPPLLISIPFLLALGNTLDPGTLNGPYQLFIILGITLLLFFFIYLVYIFMAYASLKRRVLPE